MTTAYTSLLGLALPVTGELTGTWGDTVNDYITTYLDGAVAGTQIISGSLTAVTLSKTTGASLSQAGTGATGSSQYQIIRCTGNPASLLTITVPAADKTYVIINATSTSQSVKIVGVGPTTGVTIASGKTTMVAWSGSDFVELTPNTIAGILPVVNGGTGTSTPALVAGTNISITGTWPNQTITGPVSTGASIKPSLLLDFANSKTLDPRITFTRASTATYTGYDGLIKTAASGAPRFDFNPTTGESLGILIEESRTNLLTYSEQFDNAAWTKVGTASVTANNVTAPDGTLTADTLNFPAMADRINPFDGTAVTSNTTYTASIWLSGTGTIELSLANGNGTYAITTNEITLTPVLTRYQVTHTTSATTTISYFIVGRYNGTGTATSAVAWGAQLEAGSFATSYIPTTSAQATRAADSAVMTGTNFSSWYRQDEGTVLANSSKLSAELTNYPFVASINDGTTANELAVLWANSLSRLYIAVNITGSNTVDIGANGLTQTANNLISGAYKLNDFAASNNANTVTVDSTSNVPLVNRLSIGSRNGNSQLNGHIAKLAYYPKRLSNAELQSITTV